MRTIAIVNQKGGVGKTTTALNLAHALALRDARVCAIDLDPQAQLTAGLGFAGNGHAGLAELFHGDTAAQDALVPARAGVDLLVPGARLAEFDTAGSAGRDAGWRLTRVLEGVTEYDFRIIDCPPNSGLLAMNALIAAGEILVPVAADFLSLQGAQRLAAVVDNVSTRLNLDLTRHILVTRYDGRRRLAGRTKTQLAEDFGANLCSTVIRESAALAESPSYGRTIFEFRRKSAGAQDYTALADELCVADDSPAQGKRNGGKP